MSDDNYLNPECAEAVRAALANSDACWRMEQEVLQRKLDEALRERDLIKNHYSAEAAAKLRAELASARAEVEMLRERLLEAERERDEARAELQKTRAGQFSYWCEAHRE